MLLRSTLIMLSFCTSLFFLSGCNSSKAMEEQRAQVKPKTEISTEAAALPSAAVAADTVKSEATATRPGIFELSGVAKPIRTSVLSTKIGGILRSIKAREGQRVVAGQVLCIIDPTDIALRAEGAEIDSNQAKEGLQNAQTDLARAEQLHAAKALPIASLEKAQLAVRMATLNAQKADVGVRMAKQALFDTTIRAPFSGVITKVIAEEGQMITTMPPAMIFVLVDTDTLEVTVPIPERRLSQVKVGMPVSVELPAMKFKRSYKIDRISEVIDPATRSAEAIIRIDNRDHSLPAGMYAEVGFPSISADENTTASSSETQLTKTN